MSKDKKDFEQHLNQIGIRNIKEIPEGEFNQPLRGFTGCHDMPFDPPNDKTLEERQNTFVEALNRFGITDIKDIPDGCYQPRRERQEVWIVK